MTLTSEVAKKYLCGTFVETGTHFGSGVQLALDTDYNSVYSIESDPTLYEKAKEHFANLNNVFLFLGDTSTDLPKILEKLTNKATFWLDAHEINGNSSPLLAEIAHLQNHHLNCHTIMIDDRRVFSIWNLDEQQLIEEIMKINPNYKIAHEPSLIAADDILVAYL